MNVKVELAIDPTSVLVSLPPPPFLRIGVFVVVVLRRVHRALSGRRPLGRRRCRHAAKHDCPALRRKGVKMLHFRLFFPYFLYHQSVDSLCENVGETIALFYAAKGVFEKTCSISFSFFLYRHHRRVGLFGSRGGGRLTAWRMNRFRGNRLLLFLSLPNCQVL